MKKTVLSYVAGFMTATVLTCGIAYASTTKTLQAYYKDIKVYIDNVLVDLKDANGSKVEPFICDGTTYLPVRGVAQALGCQVEWDGATQSVKLYKDKLMDTTYLFDVAPPYITESYNDVYSCDTYFQSKTESFLMGGKKYTNGLTIAGCNSDHSYALFNLNGKFKTLKCVIGYSDEFKYKQSVGIAFIVDGKTVKEYNITPDTYPQEISIPLNYGLQLKIVTINKSGKGEAGIGNMIVE